MEANKSMSIKELFYHPIALINAKPVTHAIELSRRFTASTGVANPTYIAAQEVTLAIQYRICSYANVVSMLQALSLRQRQLNLRITLIR
jgi:hypothetical protein